MTPAERKHEFISYVQHEVGSPEADLAAGFGYTELLAYFDNHEDPDERALGQALRYGLEDSGLSHYRRREPDCDIWSIQEGFGEFVSPLYRINIPQAGSNND